VDNKEKTQSGYATFEVRLVRMTSLATVVKNQITGHLIHSGTFKATYKQLVRNDVKIS
jgi:hypothetical protein